MAEGHATTERHDMAVDERRKRRSRRLTLEPLESRLALDASMLLDINSTPVARGSYPRMFTEVNGEVYFLTSDIVGDELWRVTDDSAEQVIDFNLDLVVDGIRPGHLRKIESIEEWDGHVELRTDSTRLRLDENDELSIVFSPSVPIKGANGKLHELDGWRFGSSQDTFSDGSVLNQVFDVTSEGSPEFVLTSDGRDFAGAFTSHFATLGNKVVAARQFGVRVADGSLTVPPLRIEFFGKAGAFHNAGELVYFFAGNGTSLNLWQTDGTDAGTLVTSDIVSSSSGAGLRPMVRQTLSSTDELFFVYSDEVKTEPFRLWHSDGEDTGPLIDVTGERLGDPIEIGSRTLIPEIDEGTILVGTEQVPTHGTLIATDGTPEGTVRIINEQATLHSNPQFTVWNDAAYFVAHTDQDGYELWKTDGTLDGTSMLTGVGRGIETSNISNLRVLNDRLIFVADSEFGRELWSTDGTSEGTNLVRDINPGTVGSDPDQFLEFNGQLLFAAYANATGSEFWITDGSTEGTRLLMDFSPGPESTNPSDFAVIDDQIYFSSNTGDTGYEPWVSDGTLEGTRLIKNIVDEGTDSAIPRELTVAGDRVFFSADDGIHGQELWVTDGTSEGTRLVYDIASGPASSDISEITTIGSGVYFAASDDIHGRELWFSDGTKDGTRMVADIVSGPVGSGPYNITTAGGSVYFAAFDFDHGDELWISDGTSAGTRLVIDAMPGEADSYPRSLFPHDGKLYFVASTLNASGQSQGDLWGTDGTPDGSQKLQSDDPDCKASLSEPFDLSVVGSDLYFVRCSSAYKVSGQGVELIDLRSPFRTNSVDRLVPNQDELLLQISAHELHKFDVETEQLSVFALFGAYYNRQSEFIEFAWAGNSIFYLEGMGDGRLTFKRLSRGSVEVREITGADGMMNNAPVFFEVIDGFIYLVADHVELGRELWRSDGTTEGTHVITDIAPSVGDSHPSEFLRLGDRLLFRATADDFGSELWSIDLPQYRVQFDQDTWEILESGLIVGEPISISRDGPLEQPLSVSVSYVSGSATKASEPGIADYLGSPTTYTFEPGESSLIVSPPTIFPDSNPEPTEHLLMQLRVTDGTDYTTTVYGESTLTIFDDDFGAGDINQDGKLNSSDLDRLVRRIHSDSGFDFASDLNQDGVLDTADIQVWLEGAGRILNPTGERFLFGDANLDGFVTDNDFRLQFLNTHTTEYPWTIGHDFNADGFNDGSDFNIWLSNRTTSPVEIARRARQPRAALLRAPNEQERDTIERDRAVFNRLNDVANSLCVDLIHADRSSIRIQRDKDRRSNSIRQPSFAIPQLDALLGNVAIFESLFSEDLD